MGEKKHGTATVIAVGLGGLFLGNALENDNAQQAISPTAPDALYDAAESDITGSLPEEHTSEEIGKETGPAQGAQSSNEEANTEPQPSPEPPPVQAYSPPEIYTSFSNCSAARAAGAAPVYRGDPGYGSHLDRDNDGVGCE